MTSACPDWTTLTAHRRAAPDAPAADAPAGWEVAMEHLEGCPACRHAALAADPLLAFGRLPAIEARPAEIDEIRAGVAALRRARRVTHGAESRGDGARSGTAHWWWRGAAVAVLVAGLLTVQPEVDRSARREVAPWDGGGSLPLAALTDPSASAVDDIEHPTASVYHFDDEQVGVVMVVDAGLDV